MSFRKIIDLPYWEQLTYVDPMFDHGMQCVYAWDQLKAYCVRGGGGGEVYEYDLVTDNISWLVNLPWGTHGGTGITYCANRKRLYVARGFNSPNFATINLDTLAVTTLADAPFNVGYDTDEGGQPALVHPCTALNPNIPPVTYTKDTTNYTAGPDDQIYLVRGMDTTEFAMYNIAQNHWVTRAGTPWNNRAAGIYWLHTIPDRLILLRRQGTRNWALFNMAANTWTSYTWDKPRTVDWWWGKAYPLNYDGKNWLIIPSPAGYGESIALDLDANKAYLNVTPRYYGYLYETRPSHFAWIHVEDGIPYFYLYAGRGYRGSFARVRLITIELGLVR